MSAPASTRLKALRTLVRVRERQAAALQRTHAQATGQLAGGRELLEAALGEQASSHAAEAAARVELDALTRAPFTPEALRALDFRIEERQAAVQQALRQVRDREAAVLRLEAAVAEAAAAVRLNERRIEGFREQVERLLQEREAAQEELAEEETEEASTARFVARLRAAAEASHG